MRLTRSLMLALFLLAAAAPVRAETDLLARPQLFGIVGRGDIDDARAALRAGAAVNQSDRNGNTPLLLAVRSENEAMVDLLLTSGARPNVEDRGGMTPLMWAAESGNTALIDRLIAGKAQVNRRNGSGLTALMVAAREGRLEAVQHLLAAGADPSITDYTGRDALSWADDSRSAAVKDALKAD